MRDLEPTDELYAYESDDYPYVEYVLGKTQDDHNAMVLAKAMTLANGSWFTFSEKGRNAIVAYLAQPIVGAVPHAPA
jgi:hypothetical protein